MTGVRCVNRRGELNEFRRLTAQLRRLSPEWPIRRISVEKTERIRRGHYRGQLVHAFTIWQGMALSTISMRLRLRESAGAFGRLMKKLGYQRHSNRIRGWYTRECSPANLRPNLEHERILTACTLGQSEPPHDHGRSVRMRSEGDWDRKRSQKPSWDFLDWLRTGNHDWHPTLLFLRRVRLVRKHSIPWFVIVDGYWEPSCRVGVEIDFLVQSKGSMSPRQWRSLRAIGFMSALKDSAGRLGSEESLRPRLGLDDFEGKHQGPFLASFQRSLAVDQVYSEARALLEWSPFE